MTSLSQEMLLARHNASGWSAATYVPAKQQQSLDEQPDWYQYFEARAG